MKVELRDVSDNFRRANYEHFDVGVAEEYRLSIDGYSSDRNWFIHDAMSRWDNQSFSTPDKDQDSHPYVNCALRYGSGGWWVR